jgi:uncharacterized protein YjdB
MRSVVHPPATPMPRCIASLIASCSRPSRSLTAPCPRGRRSAVRIALALAGGLAMDACESTQEPRPVASVTVTPGTASLTALDDTTRLTARALDAGGRALGRNAFTWTSSDPMIAAVDASGLVTAVANGAATITATSDGVPGTAAVSVAQVVATVTVTPDSASLNVVGGTVQLAAAAQDSRGHEIAGVAFAWSSSDSSIVTVDASGVVTAVASGRATVTATASGTGASAAVTVAQKAASVTLTPTAATLNALGAAVQLTVTARDSNGHAIPGKTFTWASSDSGIATVGASGLVTAVANGAASIMAMADGAADTADVTVTQVLSSIAVTPATPSLAALGVTVQLQAAALDSNAHAIAGKTFSWASSDQSVVTVDPSSGLVTAVANGAATVTATVEGVDGSTTVTVAQKATRVALSPAGASVSGVGATHQYAVEAWDARDNPIPGPGVHATWTSLNPNVATVNASSGLAAAVGAGQVTIRVAVDGVVDHGLLTVVTPGLSPVNLWAQLDYGMRDQVQGLWGASATDVFAAAAPYVLHYGGTTWSKTFESHDVINMDVWGGTASDVYVVGSGATVRHYDGTLWTLHTSGLSGTLAAIWGASPRDIFAVSWDGTVLRFDGAAWSSMGQVAASGFMDVWGTSARDVYAVGQQSAFHFDGTSWSDISTGVTGNIEAVWGVSPTDVYAAGYGGNVFHYDGTGWTRIVMDAPISVKAIWGSSSTDVYFGGGDPQGHAAVLHYDGTFWQLTRSPIPYGLVSIWGAPTGEVFASGNDGPYLSMGGTIVRGYRGATVTLSPPSATITGTGNQVQLVPAASAGGSPVTGATYLWTSSDTAVATVDGDGWVTGLTNGTATITGAAFGGVAATATVTVSLTQVPPVAVIDLPVADTLITRGESVEFRGTATDADGTIASHHWDFGDGTTSSVEDPGFHAYADVGVYRVTYRATDDDGATSPAATLVITVVHNQLPTASISSPANGAVFAPGDAVTFTGVATDHEDGVLTGSSLVWTSDLDGQIGTGTSFTKSDLSEGTHTIRLDATDSYGHPGTARVTISVRSNTPLYLASTGSTGLLSSQPAASGYVTMWLYNYGSGQSTEFQAVLGNAITGTGYGFSLWLGAGTAAGQTGTWTADVIVEHQGSRTTLATNTFSVPYSNLFVQYAADVTGIAGGVAGDTLILRLTLNGVSEGAVRFGAPPLDSHILVPGLVTLSPLPAPAAIPAARAPGVRVEVGAGQSLAYPGR